MKEIDTLLTHLIDGFDLSDFYKLVDELTNTDALSGTVIYQYSTWTSLFNGIIRTNCEDSEKVHLFSTNCQYMNDPGEIDFGERYIDIVCEKLFNNISDFHDPRHKNSIFLTSFSKLGNELPMWNMYGKNGDGICVGYDFNLLSSTSAGKFGRCIYDSKNVQGFVADSLPKDRSDSRSNDFELFVNYLYRLMALVKHGCYEYESEIRMYRTFTGRPEYRLVNNKIVPFIDNIYPKEVIKEIIIGPCNDFERSSIALQGWLHKNGMDHVNVIVSTIPYVNNLNQ